MTSRRRLLLFGQLAGVTVAVSLAVWLLWPSTSINPENAAKIQNGMTLAEVEVILGGPARDESTGPLYMDVVSADFAEADGITLDLWLLQNTVATVPQQQFWVSNRMMIRVILSEGRVARHVAFPVSRIEESPLDTLRRWFHL